MSRELVENLYNKMVETNNSIEAKIIKDMYEDQDFKNPMLTEFFNKKYAELKINDFSKILNKENVGLATDCQINILTMEGITFPIVTFIDDNKKSIQIGLSIKVLNEITKKSQTAKASLSILQSVGIQK